jgi:hypothetical protein
LIGEATTAVGAGSHPYWVHGGLVYLTGPYNGGPFGLSIVVPTSAGPYTLTGNAGPGREVVRAAIRVNPHTAQITVDSDPLPSILEGIPLKIRTVDVTINRPNFTFNPTNCAALTTEATFTSSRAASASSSSPFFASNCAALPFHPTLTATSQAKTSRPNGASLTIDVTAKPGEANVAKTDIQLPPQLPSRVNTLHHACLVAQFEANPAACPPEAVIGTATVTTPVLANPLVGPIILVSYGNAAFPDAEAVLQGEGVTAILDGKTNIEHSITYSNFDTIPDVPFASFRAELPAGPHSIFGAFLPESAHESLCGQKLTIPTRLVGQNGKQFTQSTPIAVSGCRDALSMSHTHIHRKGTRTLLTVTVFSPAAGTLHMSARGLRPATLKVPARATRTLTLTVRRRHPRSTRLTLTLRSTSGHATSISKRTAL